MPSSLVVGLLILAVGLLVIACLRYPPAGANSLVSFPPKDDPAPELYGYDRTWHRTSTVDVELDGYGHVVAVWFRCMALPFKESMVGASRAKEMREMYKNYRSKLLAVHVAPEEK